MTQNSLLSLFTLLYILFVLAAPHANLNQWVLYTEITLIEDKSPHLQLTLIRGKPVYYLLNTHSFPYVASSMWPFSWCQSTILLLPTDKIIIPLSTPPLTKNKNSKKTPFQKGKIARNPAQNKFAPIDVWFQCHRHPVTAIRPATLKGGGDDDTKRLKPPLNVFFAQTSRADRRALVYWGEDELKWDWRAYKGKCSCLRGRDTFMLPLLFKIRCL